MSALGEKLQRFWHELRRRKTVQTAVAYLILIAAVVGPASDILDGLGAPQWILRSIIIVLIVGFPIVIILSWLYDFTLHGIVRTEEEPEPGDTTAKDEGDYDSVHESSVTVETGTAHQHQVTLLRCTFVLLQQDKVINDPETLLRFVPSLEQIIATLAEKYTARELNRDGTTFEFVFGFPSAYEDDAIRAVALSLAVADEVQRLNQSTDNNSSTSLGVACGVFSDFVIVDADPANSEEIKVVGSALQATTWVQSFAPPGATTLDQFTFRLLRNRVRCELLGEFNNPQRGHATNVYQAVQLREAELDPSVYDDFRRVFVGRTSELDLILDRWEQAKDGEEEFVILRGEPGIGKTTLIHEAISRIRESDQAQILPLFCSPLERNTAFKPIIDCLLGPGFGIRKAATAEQRAQRVTDILQGLEIDREWAAPLIASLLATGGEAQPFNESTRKELIQCLLELVYATAKNRPLVFVVEDLHWADPSTLEIVSMLVSDDYGPGLLCLFTTRPHLKLPWESRSNVTTLNLQSLSKRATRDLVDNFLRELDLPDSLVKQLVDEAGGNPLFAEELAKAVFETTRSDPDYKHHNLVLPGTLQRSLASRMDNLGSAKPLLQLCSLLGREFDYALLQSVAAASNDEKLNQDLQLLVNAEFLFQRGTIPRSSYTFKHILMQETAYQSLLKSTRKDFHSRIADTLNADPDARSKNPEILAYHYEGSERFDQALGCWILAANRALSTQSMVEAAELANNGLKVLARLPASRELDMAKIQLLGIRGRALLTSSGYAEPEVEQTFRDALTLCEEIGDVPQLFMFLCGLWSYFQIGGTVKDAETVALRLMRLADADNSPAKKVQALYCIGYTSYRGGRLQQALDYMEKAEEIAATNDVDYCEYSPSGDDGRIHNSAVSSHINWQLGKREQAFSKIEQAVALSEELGNPVGKVFAYFLYTWLMHLDNDYESAITWADKSLVLARENQLSFWIPNSLYIKSWAEFHLKRDTDGTGPEEVLDTMRKFVARSRLVGARFGTVELLLTTSEAIACNGHLNEAAEILDEATRLVTETGEGYLQPEVNRIAAEIQHLQGNDAAAIKLYERAIAIAEDQQSLSYGARARQRLQELGEGPGNPGPEAKVTG